jgi:hypothetical protein
MLRDLNQDFVDLIRFLIDHNVEFLVVGAHALDWNSARRSLRADENTDLTENLTAWKSGLNHSWGRASASTDKTSLR